MIIDKAAPECNPPSPETTATGTEPVKLCGRCEERPARTSKEGQGRAATLCQQCADNPLKSKVCPFIAAIGRRTRERRDALDMPLRILAKRVGHPASNLAVMERGYQTISLQMAVRIAEALGCTLDWLLTGEGTEERPKAA